MCEEISTIATGISHNAFGQFVWREPDNRMSSFGLFLEGTS